MPVFNCEKYLLQSARSILDQTFRDFELIVVDDGSTDSTLAIIEQMRADDSRIVVINREHKGIAASMNAGLQAARGQFIACMDADDVATSNRFSLQLEFLKNNPDVVLVGGLIRNIDAQGRLTGRASIGNPHSELNLRCFPAKVVKLPHPTVMARAAVLRAAGGWDPRYEYALDYEMFIRIGQLGQIACDDQYVLNHRVHGENTSITNLVDQERHAANAELDHVRAARKRSGKGELRLAPETFEAYVSIRILRREYDFEKLNGPAAFLKILYGLVKGSLNSEIYTTGRLMLMVTFHGLRTMKAALFGRKTRSVMPSQIERKIG